MCAGIQQEVQNREIFTIQPDGRTLVFNYGPPMQGDRIGLIVLDGGAPHILGGSLAASDPDWSR